MANKNKKVLIAGGGIGGITALLALRQRGIDAELFEQTAAFGQVGAGLQVSSNSTRVLRTLGLGDALAKVAYAPESARLSRLGQRRASLLYAARGSEPKNVSARRITPRTGPTCSMCCSAASRREVSVSAAVSSASIRTTTA